MTSGNLDAGVRRDLRGLQKDTAESVARHLVAAGRLVDTDPERALEHARYARRRASRIAVVREAAGIAAYHAGEWSEALSELRAARRMGGGPGHLAVMADIERALGRPERALEIAQGPEVGELGRSESIELAIVAAGARRDLDEADAAVVGLQIPELDPARRDPWSARLFYAYADNLLAAGREADALRWFVHAADVDDEGATDAPSRIAELTGEPAPEEDEIVFGLEELDPAAEPGPPADSDPGAGPGSGAGSGTGPRDAGGDGPDGGTAPADGPAGSRRGSSSPTAGSGSAGPDGGAGPDMAGADPAGANGADGGRPDPDRADGSGSAASDPTGSHPAGPDPAGSGSAAAGVADSDRPGPGGPAGSDPTGADGAGDGPGSDPVGSDPAGPGRPVVSGTAGRVSGTAGRGPGEVGEPADAAAPAPSVGPDELPR